MNKPLNKNTLTQNTFANFAYNGMKLDNEVSGNGNSYTAEFWQYDARLGRRWNQDPVVKHWMSPYHAFSDNPIINIDPNGAVDDDYRVDRKGNISLEKKTNDDFDVIKGTNEKGEENSIQIKEGIISSKQTEKFNGKEKILQSNDEILTKNFTKEVELYKCNESEGKQLFEFMAQNTEVEWSFYSAGTKSRLATSHDESKEFSWFILKNDEEFLKSNFSQFDHNHPGNSTSPSGYTFDKPVKDIAVANSMQSTFSDRILKFNIYTNLSGYNPYTISGRINININAKKPRPLTKESYSKEMNSILFIK